MIKKTKILCTIGPVSMNKEVISQLYDAGMNAARINMSHGDFNQYLEIISNVRNSCNIPIIIDTQGPEVRTINENIKFKKGDIVSFGLNVNIFSKLKKGLRFFINNGLDEGVIENIKDGKVYAVMKNDGELYPNKSISFRDVKLNLPSLTKKDLKGIEFAKKNDIEFIALSFTRNKKDVLYIQEKLKGSSIKVIAKIENQEGVDNFDEIISVADGAMVARGDLGTEIDAENVPIIQKEMIKKCNLMGKPVIVATQMMESMVNNKIPTRAEVSDVANAIIDGADCVMLSAETSIGRYPILVVKTMAKICLNTEKHHSPTFIGNESKNIEDIIAYNAGIVSSQLDAKIICLTRSGYTARIINRSRPKNYIIAFTPNRIISLQLMINYGIFPIYYKELNEYNSDEVHNITKLCLEKKFINESDNIVFSAGLFIKKTTNTIIAYKVKELMESS